MPIGRNDPCPCGSGKKYKKCHGAAERPALTSPEAARANVLKGADTALTDRLMRFARSRYGPRWLRDSLEAEGLLDGDQIPDAEMGFLIPWLLHFMPNTDEGLTLAQEWRAHEARRLSDEDRRLLVAYDQAWVSIWEVAAVDPGVGSRLTDMLTREERFVHDVSSSATLQRFDSVLALVVTCDDLSFFAGLHPRPLSPRFAEIAVREARRMCRVRTRPVAPDKLRNPDLQLELLALWNALVDEMLDQPPPVLSNTDGDPIALTKDDFAILAPRADVASRLASFPGAEQAEATGDETRFVVMRAGNAVHRSWQNTVIGHIALTGTRLTVETNSMRRADSLRAAVEAHLNGLVRFRLRKEENTEQLMAGAWDARGMPAEHPEKPVPPEMAAALREFRERGMRDWLDESIPALDGLTPRQAASVPAGRRKLETLLKEFEQTEARLPVEQRIDLAWIREALGVP